MTEEKGRRKTGVETAERRPCGNPTKVTSTAFFLLRRKNTILVASPQTPGSSCLKRGVAEESAFRSHAGGSETEGR